MWKCVYRTEFDPSKQGTEHERHPRLYQPDRSTAAEHSIESGHRIKFPETEVLAKRSGSMDQLVKEAIAIIRHQFIKAFPTHTHTSRKYQEDTKEHKIV
jgi:hypothetical protein